MSDLTLDELKRADSAKELNAGHDVTLSLLLYMHSQDKSTSHRPEKMMNEAHRQFLEVMSAHPEYVKDFHDHKTYDLFLRILSAAMTGNVFALC